MLMGLEGVKDREAAQRLRGRSLYMDADECIGEGLPLPLHALVGMEVRRPDGSKAVVASLQYSSTNPLLLLEGEDGEFAVPVRLILREGRVDWSRSVVEIDLPAGLEEVWRGRA
jgi:ribosomal 30S subunit maturation factor RimM